MTAAGGNGDDALPARQRVHQGGAVDRHQTVVVVVAGGAGEPACVVGGEGRTGAREAAPARAGFA